jgi:soluble lytic murein transglycosylase
VPFILLLGVSCLLTACDRRDGEAGASETSVVVQGDSTLVTVSPEATELVLRAREHDRADARDSARAAYLEAAERLPPVADWLLLRAAGVIADSAERAELYGRVATAVARDRVPMTEALARERTGDIAGAIRAYQAADAPVSAFRLRLARTTEANARSALRREMLQFIGGNQGTDPARDAIAIFDQGFPTRSAQEELVLARAAAASGRAARAVAGYAVATRANLVTPRDRFAYGNMLARLGRHADAIPQYTSVREPSGLAAAAHYQAARMRIASGNVSAARTMLRAIASEWPGDTSAASALMLLADLATDENRDEAARAAYRDAARRFPAARHAPAASFRAALIAYVQGHHRVAATEFLDIVARYPSAEDAPAARYWGGRALLAAGQRPAADSVWRALIAREPGSYYTVLATRRMQIPLLVGTPDTLEAARPPDIQAAVIRAAILDTLGMSAELRHEYDRLFRDAGQDPDRMLATAEVFSGTDQATRAITLGWRLINEVGRTPRTYRIVYPVLERERIVAEARANRVDPVLVASLIRQESNFNPRALSPAGARGLMQIMPAVGRQLAAQKGIANYSPDILYEPGVNLALGTLHLRHMLSQYANLERALAAYNAGGSRVRRWVTKAGSEDPEVFTERIPFVETRGYVRAIVRNRAFYQALYPW